VESLGAKLRTARENKGYSFDEVSRMTNIAGRYLEALETEDFAVFPGETYVLGFLRNYGAYLGLDVNDLLSSYRSFKIQEQPVPVEALLRSPSPAPKILGIVFGIAAVLGLGAGGYLFFTRVGNGEDASAAPVRQPETVMMNTGSLERRFYRGDVVIVPLENSSYKLELSNLGDAVTLAAPGGAVRLELSQEVQVDLDNDGAGDLRITAMDFEKNNPAPGALLRLAMESAAIPEASPAAALGAGTAASQTILTSPSSYPFTLQAAFQGYCLFRWEVLAEPDRAGRNEQYFQRSAEPLNVQAQNGVRVGASNARAAQLQVIAGGKTYPLELGGAGEVVVADIRWVREAENRYSLVLSRLE